MTTMKKFGMVMALGLALFVTAPGRAMAQQDDTQTKIIPSLELDQADVRDALRALFRNVNVNYSIAPEVQGTVTVSLKNVLFETALQFILKQVDATYRIESGVYQIIHREAQLITPTNPDTGTQLVPTQKVVRRLYIRYADPQFIFTMLKGNTNVSLTPEISKARNGRCWWWRRQRRWNWRRRRRRRRRNWWWCWRRWWRRRWRRWHRRRHRRITAQQKS